MITKIIIFLTFIFLSNFSAQQFGPELIIEENNTVEASPSIDIDSQGNLGILWWNKSISADSIKFVKSYDGGASFDTVRIVDILPYNPDAGWPETPLIRFDTFDNPIVFYQRWVLPFSYFHFSKKSSDGGKSFPQQKYSFLSRNWHLDLLNLDSNACLLAYSYYPTRNVMAKRSVDGGLSYSDSTLIYTGNGEPYNTSLTKCGNGDILCFYSRYNEVNYNRSTDSGLTFSNNISLESPFQYQDIGDVKSFQNKMFIVYVATIDTPSFSRKIVFDKSEDNGFSYGNHIVIRDWGGVGIEANVNLQMVFNPNVGICILWTDYLTGSITDKTWFRYSDDFGESFYPPILVTEGYQWTTKRAMAISDSGDVYVTYYNISTNKVVLRKTLLPVITKINQSRSTIFSEIKLINNYPNPFNSSTQISFQLPKSNQIDVSIFDLRGRKVITLIHKTLSQGEYVIRWDGKDDMSREVSSGIYLCRLSTNYTTLSKKLIYIK